MGDDQRGIHWDVPREEGFAGRTEALTGATGRRRWPDEVRARIVADVARLHGTRRAGGSTIGASSPGGGVLARLDPFRGAMFVFPSRRADRIRVLVWGQTGLVPAHQRLAGGTFAWPKIADGVLRLSPAQFSAPCVRGVDRRRVRAERYTRPPVFGLRKAR